MHSTVTRLFSFLLLIAVGLVVLPHAGAAQPCQCQLPDNGFGTVTMPPGCIDGYQGNMQIVNGLTGGATIQISAKLYSFALVNEVPGGTLGGTSSTFDATLQVQMSGTGPLAGYNRLIAIPITGGQLDFGPRVNNAPVQTFGGDPRNLQGSIFGDPDFDVLHFRAGTANGFPGTGGTTLTRVGGIGTDFIVDSFFDVEYEIEFQGAPGSILEGMGGIHADFSHLSVCGTPPVAVEETSWGEVKARYRE